VQVVYDSQPEASAGAGWAHQERRLITARCTVSEVRLEDVWVENICQIRQEINGRVESFSEGNMLRVRITIIAVLSRSPQFQGSIVGI
jgi:hypothetical protein